MNYIKQLTAFFEKASSDFLLNPSHISLYMALFQCWNLNRFKNPISINRNQTMKLSKIGSSHTYLKCLNDLQSFGYIKYEPSHNPLKGSLVYLCIFDTSTEQVLHNSLCNIGTSTEQVLHPSLNIINILNNKTNIKEQPKNENQFLISENMKSEKPKRKKEFLQPDLNEVITFFKTENFPELEARKFFNHFESNGWKVGGKTPMNNWNAAARNWILNSKRFIAPNGFPKPQTPKPLPNGKNYAEPL